jgi:anthranilate phosphoribosyltransferase
LSLKPVLGKLVDGLNLEFEEAKELMKLIMMGKATDAQIGCFLAALRMKGETVEEVAGFASAMRECCQRINPKVNGKLLDTCGTGGDEVNTFNISTLAAFVTAGAGIAIAKHGNRSVTSMCGSADVLEQLGLRLDLTPKDVERLIEKVGIGFMFAPIFHPAMKYAIGPRRELGIRSVFNILGPLTNPANASLQLLGVYSPELTEPMARALQKLGVEEAMVVHGMDGIDEISTIGETKVSWLREGDVKTTLFKPKDFGVNQTSIEKLRGYDSERGAEIAYKVLVGSAEQPQMDVVLANSVAGIRIAGLSDGFNDGLDMARESIESGAAFEKLRQLVELSGGDLSRLEKYENE